MGAPLKLLLQRRQAYEIAKSVDFLLPKQPSLAGSHALQHEWSDANPLKSPDWMSD